MVLTTPDTTKTAEGTGQPPAAATPAPAVKPAATQSTTTEEKPTEQPPAAKPDDQPKPSTAPAAETKPAEAAKPEEPLKYEFKAPEGQKFDDAVLSAFTKAVSDNKVAPEVAQKILDGVAPVLQQRLIEQVEAQRTEQKAQWAEELRADPKIGGAKLEASMQVAQKALNSAAGEGFLKLLLETGLDRHPDMIRAWHWVGTHLSEDSFVGGTSATAKKTTADVLFGAGEKK